VREFDCVPLTDCGKASGVAEPASADATLALDSGRQLQGRLAFLLSCGMPNRSLRLNR